MRIVLASLLLLSLVVVANAQQPTFKDSFQLPDSQENYKVIPEKSWYWSQIADQNVVIKPVSEGYSYLAVPAFGDSSMMRPGYTAELWIKYQAADSAPARIMILAGVIKATDKTTHDSVYGYEIVPLIKNGALALNVWAVYQDGKTRRIDNMGSKPWSNIDMEAWGVLTAKVEIDSTATKIKVNWESRDRDGQIVNHSVSATDASASRMTYGQAMILRTIKEKDGRTPKYLIDELAFTKLPQPPPVYIRPQGG